MLSQAIVWKTALTTLPQYTIALLHAVTKAWNLPGAIAPSLRAASQ